MSVTLIRHAQSTFNAFGDQQRDCPLTDRGIKDAKNIKGNYELIICSTLRRARQTLEYSSLNYKTVIYTDLCREVRDGNPINLLSGEENVSESAIDIQDRIQKFKEFLGQYSSKRMAVISHGIFLGYLSGKASYNCEQWSYKL